MTLPAGGGIGILGGMGPAATIDFYAKLIEATPAGRDQEHLPVVVWADPRVPDRSDFLLGGGDNPTPWLRRGIDSLRQAGCDLLVVPCNTAHAFLPALARDAGMRFVSMVDVAADVIAAEGTKSVGLLGTTGTLRSRLYADALEARGVATLEPHADHQGLVTQAIAAVKAGDSGPADADALAAVSRVLAERGAEQIIAACTEIVLALGGRDVRLPIVDPARLLARRVVEIFTATGGEQQRPVVFAPPLAIPS
jgi:aspartate racemase